MDIIKKYNPEIKPKPHISRSEFTEGKEFVTETGKHICYYQSPICMVKYAKQRLEENGYDTSFAEWDQEGRLLTWLGEI